MLATTSLVFLFLLPAAPIEADYVIRGGQQQSWTSSVPFPACQTKLAWRLLKRQARQRLLGNT